MTIDYPIGVLQTLGALLGKVVASKALLAGVFVVCVLKTLLKVDCSLLAPVVDKVVAVPTFGTLEVRHIEILYDIIGEAIFDFLGLQANCLHGLVWILGGEQDKGHVGLGTLGAVQLLGQTGI